MIFPVGEFYATGTFSIGLVSLLVYVSEITLSTSIERLSLLKGSLSLRVDRQ